MILTDTPPKIADEVIAEVRAIKRGISERHGDDINRLLEALTSKERASGISGAAEGAGQSAAAAESNTDDTEKPNPESEERPW